MHTLRVATLHPIGWGWERLIVDQESRLNGPLDAHQAPILFVHGALHNASAFFSFERSLRALGFSHIRSVELMTSIKSIESLADRLKLDAALFVERRRQSLSTPKLRIVCHSLGGIVVRTALCDPTFAQNVDQVIFLGTPHQGLNVRLPFPRAMYDLSVRSKLIDRLKNEPLAGGIRYHNLRGQLDLVTPLESTYLPFVPNRVFQSVGHVGLLSRPEVVQTVVEILEGPLYSAAPDVESRTTALRFG